MRKSRDSMRAMFGTSPYDLGAELLQLSILAEAEVDHFFWCEM